MNTTQARALLTTACAVPFTHTEAASAERNIMGRYTRAHLLTILKARRIMRLQLRVSIAGGHYLQAVEQATLIHSYGVHAVLMIRRSARAFPLPSWLVAPHIHTFDNLQLQLVCS
jgi:hypothetical protein